MKLKINDVYMCEEEVRQLGYPVCIPGQLATVLKSTDTPDDCCFPHLMSVKQLVGCDHDVGLQDIDLKKFTKLTATVLPFRKRV